MHGHDDMYMNDNGEGSEVPLWKGRKGGAIGDMHEHVRLEADNECRNMNDEECTCSVDNCS